MSIVFWHRTVQSTGMHQWRRKIVEFRGAEVRRLAALPAPNSFSIAKNSPDDSLLLSWVHSVTSIPASDSDKLSTPTLPSILHLFASLTHKERCNCYTCDQITALTETQS